MGVQALWADRFLKTGRPSLAKDAALDCIWKIPPFPNRSAIRDSRPSSIHDDRHLLNAPSQVGKDPALCLFR